MYIYETKIISHSGKMSLQIAEDHLSDLVAIRAARKLCGDGESVEIWRDDVCIYSGRIKKPIALVWPATSERPAG
jgi:hypothetical protein